MIKKLKNIYHYFLAWFGAVKYRHPSEELFVIGITGTSGKSSTVYWLRQVLEAAGFIVGSLSTIDFYIAGKQQLNDQKMTMLGRMQIQKYLRDMVDAHCDIAILEMTSEGALQHRNKCINVDMMALTNLYPEHIEAHGGFENYKKSKLRLFEYVAKSKRKTIRLKDLKIDRYGIIQPKTAVVNGNSEYYEEFLQFPFESKMKIEIPPVVSTKDGISFQAAGHAFHPKIYGEYNASNLACVITIARSVYISWETLEKAINTLSGVPGRVEFIHEAEKKGFQVIVDYAFEPVALSGLYDVVTVLKPKRVIHVLGGTGGGRDTSRRAVMGSMAGEKANIVIVTNEDPYDEDPKEIIRMVADGARSAGKVDETDLFIIEDRKEAIGKALRLAQPGDLVLVTGKGSEQRMCIAPGVMIPWDDRGVVRQHLNMV